jgi:hypothetical protein
MNMSVITCCPRDRTLPVLVTFFFFFSKFWYLLSVHCDARGKLSESLYNRADVRCTWKSGLLECCVRVRGSYRGKLSVSVNPEGPVCVADVAARALQGPTSLNTKLTDHDEVNWRGGERFHCPVPHRGGGEEGGGRGGDDHPCVPLGGLVVDVV